MASKRLPKPWHHQLTKVAQDRRDRLAACGWAREVWSLIPLPDLWATVEVAELAADGRGTAAELEATGRAAWALVKAGRKAKQWSQAQGYAAEVAAWTAARFSKSAYGEAARIGRYAQKANGQPESDGPLPDIFPFRDRPSLPVIDPDWLSWNDGTAGTLAVGIYADRAFDRMPILADALEEAGCADPDILDHCRGDGSHVRG